MSVTGEREEEEGKGRRRCSVAGAAFGHTLHLQVGDDTQENRESSPGLLEGELTLKITFTFSDIVWAV